MVPLGWLTSKKPLPLMARSRSLPVTVMLPCVKSCDTVATVTPMPLLAPPAALTELAYNSANSARELFMPTVLALAMLWPITSRLRLALFRPESPCWNAMVMSLGWGKWCEK
ncbi:hypothetical protein FQZ97_768950 [compost metagenome]